MDAATWRVRARSLRNFPTSSAPISLGCDGRKLKRLTLIVNDQRYCAGPGKSGPNGHITDLLTANIAHLNANRVPGKSFWIENYYSAAREVRPGTLNLEFPVPPAQHSTPSDWYFTSWNMATSTPTNFYQGVFAGAFFSVVGPGKNYQVETGQAGYYFGWPFGSSVSFPLSKLVQLSPFAYPGRLPGPVFLEGPNPGELMRPGQGVFSCQPVLNAVTYQILIGPSPRQLDWVAWAGPTPPQLALQDLPFPTTYWTVRAADAYGTTSQADPRYVYRDTDGDGLSDEIEVFVYHTDPDNADTDGDGRPDGQEVLAGTDPLSPLDAFHFGCQALTDNQFIFSWFAGASMVYSLEFSPTLSPASWQTIETMTVSPSEGFVQHVLSRPPGALGFLRIRATAP